MNSRMCPPDLKGLLNGVVGASRSPNPPLMGYTDMRRAAFSAWSSLTRILTSFRAVLAGEPIKDLLLMLSPNFLILEEFFKVTLFGLFDIVTSELSPYQRVFRNGPCSCAHAFAARPAVLVQTAEFPHPDDDDLSGREKNAVTGESVTLIIHF